MCLKDARKNIMLLMAFYYYLVATISVAFTVLYIDSCQGDTKETICKSPFYYIILSITWTTCIVNTILYAIADKFCIFIDPE